MSSGQLAIVEKKVRLFRGLLLADCAVFKRDSCGGTVHFMRLS